MVIYYTDKHKGHALPFLFVSLICVLLIKKNDPCRPMHCGKKYVNYKKTLQSARHFNVFYDLDLGFEANY